MGRLNSLLFVTCLVFSRAGVLWAQEEPELEILPSHELLIKAVGKNVLLTCHAVVKGRQLITDLQWHDPNGKVIETMRSSAERPAIYTEMMPGDGLALIIPHLLATHAGNYTCTATYANSQKLSKSVRIDTVVAVTWVDAPEEQYPILGKDYKIRCKVSANPSPSIDWRKNLEPIPSNGRYVAASDGLLIKQAEESDDGVYTCRAIVIATGELAERNIRVEVHTPPTLEEFPDSVEVVEGNDASVLCKAKGKPRPTYSWIQSSTQKNLSLADRFSVNEHTGVLTISPVAREDGGEYRCEARNAAGLVEKVVKLSVVMKPKIVALKNISIPTGKEAVLECSAAGQPFPEVTFRKLSSTTEYRLGHQQTEDRVLVENIKDAAKGETIGKLTISSVIRSDDGLYACIASNKGGKAIKNGHVTVEFKPSFLNTPQKEAWSWDNNPVNITCLAESIPNASISWKFNERDIKEEPNIKVLGKGPQSTLLVTPASGVYYGAYKCLAKNPLGSDETVIELKQAKPPSEVFQATMKVVTATTITFEFMGPRENGGLPIKAYAVHYKDERHSWKEAKNKTWAFDSPYILEGLEPQTTYDFRFAALNDAGLGPWSAHVTRTMPKRSYPEEPPFLNSVVDGVVLSPYSDQFELRWQIPADNGEPIDKYDIKYCPVHRVNDKWTQTESKCTTEELPSDDHKSYILKNLEADMHYKIELRAHNVIGYSTPGQVVIKTAMGSHNLVQVTRRSTLSSGTMISIVVAVLFGIFIIVDGSCYYFKSTGLLMSICHKTAHPKRIETYENPESDEKQPLNRKQDAAILESVNNRTGADFDLKQSVPRIICVGRDSAV